MITIEKIIGQRLTRTLTLTATLLWLCLSVAMAQDIIVNYTHDGAEVTLSANDSVSAKVDGSKVELRSLYAAHELTVRLSGESNNGQMTLVSEGRVKMVLDNLSLTSNEGAALWLKNKKRVDIEALEGTRNSLSVGACPDTASQRQAVVWAKGKVHFSGKGELNILASADGCKGINAKGDIRIDDLSLSVVTKGNNLGKDDRGFGPGFPGGGHMGPRDGGFPGGGPGFHRGDGPEGFPHGGPGGGPGFPERPDFPEGGGFPEGDDFPRGPGASGDPDEKMESEFKQRYISTTKGIKSLGTITINSGSIYCLTSSLGAEGIEGKKGVTVNGGCATIDAVDDAINSNGAIIFNGGHTIAESHCNDAIDSNKDGGFFGFPGGPGGMKHEQDGSRDDTPHTGIIVSGGEVYGWSHVGIPEEGMDCDQLAIEISGGEVFTIGAGMGEMPSTPTQKTAKQPTVLLTGLMLEKGEAVEIREGEEVVYTFTAPFTFRNSASLVSFPRLEKGKTYTLSTKGHSRSFTMTDSFVVSRR